MNVDNMLLESQQNMQDYEWVRAFAQERSEDAFRQIVEQYSPMIYSACYRRLQDTELSEDATQATFLILSKKAGKLREDVVLGSWLIKVAHFVCKDVRRASASRKKHELEAGKVRMEKPQDLEWKKAEPHIDDALATLPEKSRKAVVLHYLMGKSNKEVGREIGCTEDTARKRISNALKKLRSKLSKLGVLVPPNVLSDFLTNNTLEPIPAGLTSGINKAVLGQATTGSTMTLAKGATDMMFMAKVKVVGFVIAGVLVVGGGVGKVVGGTIIAPDGKTESWENTPKDGEIMRADLGGTVCFINLGKNHGVVDGLSFKVYRKGKGGKKIWKGRVQVAEVSPSYSKVLIDSSDFHYKLEDPLVSGDFICNLQYKPQFKEENFGLPVNGLALGLSVKRKKLIPEKFLAIDLVLKNETKRAFQLPLSKHLSGNLVFGPTLERKGRLPSYKPNFFAGKLYTVNSGKETIVPIKLRREGDRLSVYLEGRSIGIEYLLPKDLKQLKLHFRIYSAKPEIWGNLKYTHPAYKGIVTSNKITLSLLPLKEGEKAEQKFGEAVNGLALGLSADRYETVMKGDGSNAESLNLLIEAKNTTTKKIVLTHRVSTNNRMKIIITGPDDQILTEFSPKDQNQSDKLAFKKVIQPQIKDFVSSLPFPENPKDMDHHTIKRPGNYKIRVSYSANATDPWAGTITSNAITIFVMERERKDRLKAIIAKAGKLSDQDTKKAKGLIGQLDDESPNVRTKALRTLIDIGPSIAPVIARKLEENVPLEVEDALNKWIDAVRRKIEAYQQ